MLQFQIFKKILQKRGRGQKHMLLKSSSAHVQIQIICTNDVCEFIYKNSSLHFDLEKHVMYTDTVHE
jgi:hypothetical protein